MNLRIPDALSTFRGIVKRPKLDRRNVFVTLSLVAIFCSALLIRIYPVKYGFYLNEYDPYFDYYGTKYLVDKYDQKGITGWADYFSWVDHNTWYPEGRQVATSSQVGLHFTGAITYIIARNVFALNVTLYDFLVLLPVYIGALTTLVIFLLVKKINGTSGGLVAALIIAFSPPIIQRGNLGWFKSEPLALILALLASYLFLSMYDARIGLKGMIFRGITAGALLGFANTAWGGAQYFGVVFGLLFIIAPFVQTDLKRTVYGGGLLVAFNLFVSSLVPRPGPAFVLNPVGLLLIGGFVFTLVSYYVRKTIGDKNFERNLLRIIFTIFIIVLVAVSFGLVSSVSGRYLTVVLPFQRSADPLVESVAEHFVPTGIEYFTSYGILAIFAIFGAIVALRKRNIYTVFALITAISGVYIASSFSRLMVYSSLAFGILGAIGFVELSSSILKSHVATPTKKKVRLYGSRTEIKVAYVAIFIILLTIPLVYPTNSNWVATADYPVSLANAGSSFRVEMSDWSEALSWIRTNTPPDSVFVSWWDYGYWLAIIGNRTSVADNATINGTRIVQIGRMFMSSENEALPVLHSLIKDPNKTSGMRPGYVVAFVAGQQITTQTNYGSMDVYILGGGGDESKKQWFIQIGGLNVTNFLYEDEFTPKPNFWDNTIVGKMWPFTLYAYVDQTGAFQGTDYKQGYTAVYTKELHYTDDTGPLKLVFHSSSLDKAGVSGTFAAVLIYQIIK